MHEQLITVADTEIQNTQDQLAEAHDWVVEYERQVTIAQDNLEKARLEVTRLNAELDSLRTSKQYLLDDDFAEPDEPDEPEVPLTPLVPAEPEPDPEELEFDWREQIGH